MHREKWQPRARASLPFTDQASVADVDARRNPWRISQIYGDEPSLDGCPVAEGELDSMVTGNTFVGLQKYYEMVTRDPTALRCRLTYL